MFGTQLFALGDRLQAIPEPTAVGDEVDERIDDEKWTQKARDLIKFRQQQEEKR